MPYCHYRRYPLLVHCTNSFHVTSLIHAYHTSLFTQIDCTFLLVGVALGRVRSPARQTSRVNQPNQLSAWCRPARNQIETNTQDRRRLHAKRTPFIWLAAMCSRTSHSTPAVSVTVSGAACFTRVPIEISSDTHRAQSASLAMASHHDRPSLYLVTVRPSMSDRMWSAASSTVNILCLAAV